MIRRLGPLLFVMLSAGYARAEAPVAYHIEYDAKPGCSSREAFVRELTRRTERAREAVPEEEGPTLIVKLVENDGAIAGQLTLRELDGDETRRGVAGESCDETVPALALIAAVLIDPESVYGKKPPPERTVEPERPHQPKFRGFRFGGAAGATLESAIAPNVSIGAFAEFSAEYESQGRRGVSFGIGPHFATSSTFKTDDGDADFRWFAGRAWFCPVSLPNEGVFAFAPCAEVEAGVIHAEGSNTLDQQEHDVFWLAVGPLGRLELRPIRVLTVFADGIFVIPVLNKYDFRFDPATPVFTTPTFGWSARAGVRLLFP